MNKRLLIFAILINIMYSCTNPELEKQEAKSKDIECKVEAMQQLLKYDNTFRLAVSLNLGKEYNAAFSAYSDTTISCEQANKKWDAFSKKLDSAIAKSAK